MVKKDEFCDGTTSVKVALRIRPNYDQSQTQSRISKVNGGNCLTVTQDTIRVGPDSKLFTFDHVFEPTTPQCEIYSTLGKDLVPKFIEGTNVTVLAFGPASSGKSFTMGTTQQTDRFDEHRDGIIPRAMMELFEVLQQQSYNNAPLFTTSPTASTVTPPSSKRNSVNHRLFSIPSTVTPIPSKGAGTSIQPSPLSHMVSISFIEVYNEELIDLLNDTPTTEQPPITIHEDAKGQIYWVGAKQVKVNNIDDVLLYLKKGAKSRTTVATGINEKSSQTHSIFSVTLQQEKWQPSYSSTLSQYQHHLQSCNDQSHYGGEWVTLTSRFHFVDLAGGICSRKTDIEGNLRKEGTNHDIVLQAFENVMSTLGDTSNCGTHIPDRDSILTRILQDSLGGDAATVMIACASPLEQDLPETLNTLQLALGAHRIKNISRRNGAQTWKTPDNLDTNIYQSQALLNLTKRTPNYPLPPFTPFSKSSSGNSDTIEPRNGPQSMQDQLSIIADLQQQIKKLNGKASASEEHNKSVEKELQHFKNLYRQSSSSQQLNIRFEYLLEPVVEVYEQCISNLEVENSVLKAAVNFSNTAMDELQCKCDSLQQTVDHQQDTMAGLYGRLTTMIERHHSIGTYIDGLENRLKQAANDSARDQGTLNELRHGATKWQQEVEKIDFHTRNMEQILNGLQEQTHSTMHYTESTTTTTIQQNKADRNLQQQMKMSSATDWTQQQSTLHELDRLKGKCKQLETDRNRWKTKAECFFEWYPAHLDRRVKSTANSKPGSSKLDNHRTNYSEKGEQSRTVTTKPDGNKQTDTSYTALNSNTTDYQPSCVSVSKQLGNKHSHTINELDGVLQRYFEMMDHAEQLEDISIMETTQPSTTSNSVANNVSLLLSFACNSDSLTYTSGTRNISSIVDDCISELAVFSSSTDC